MATVVFKSIRVFTLRDRIVAHFTNCLNHNWSFPQRHKDMQQAYATHRPYDSHQHCPKCGSMRLYNSQTMEGGPQYELQLSRKASEIGKRGTSRTVLSEPSLPMAR